MIEQAFDGKEYKLTLLERAINEYKVIITQLNRVNRDIAYTREDMEVKKEATAHIQEKIAEVEKMAEEAGCDFDEVMKNEAQ